MKSLLPLVVAVLVVESTIHADTGATPEVSRLPEMTVEGVVQEAIPVRPYGQPEWTTARRFPTTRVYLQQLPGEVGVEQWVKAQWPRGAAPNFLFQEEIEIGLPYRFQFDLYENWRIDERGYVFHDSVAAEARWALADWGKILFNPTLYAEWKFADHARGADAYELKVLLGDQITPRLHWGFNAIYEQEVGQGRATEIGGSLAFSYTVIDEKLSVGLELKVESETERGARSHPPIEVDLGPSVQWRPTRNTHLDVVPLAGLTSDSPHVELWVIFGVDFGSGHAKGVAPVSLKSE